MKKTLSAFLSIIVFSMLTIFAFSVRAEEIPPIDDTNSGVVIDSELCDISASNQISVSLSFTTASYTGDAIYPSVSVYNNYTLLRENIDYTLSYLNNVNAGTAEIKITGIGSFTGTRTEYFTIKPSSIAQKGKLKVTFEKSSLLYYDKTVEPIMYVAYDKGGEIGFQYLIQDIDYTVTYVNVNTMGKAKAKIVGIGNYSGVYEKYFIVSPQAVSNVKISNVTNSSLVLNWDKLNKVSGYQIVQYDASKKAYKHLTYVSSKTTSYKISNLSSAKSYKYKIRAYKTVNDKKYFGDYSVEVGTHIKPAQVKVTGVTVDKKKLTVEWNKTNCSGYEIFYTTDKNMKKGVKTVTVSSKKTSAVIKGVNNKKRYYVKVRAFSNENGRIYNGKKSAVVSSYFSNVYATYYSYYENNPSRTTNLRIASKAISGTIINPGQTFSFNAVVGPRTEKKGYKSAHVFQGEEVTNGVGGGVCQVASTMFNCVLKGNLAVTERHQHSQRVAYVPLGRDAAIYGSAVDFKWTNNTKHAIKIEMTVKDGRITCTFYTCKKVKPKKVNLKVTSSGKTFTLKRTVDGKVNYKTTSKY